jgi:hypothetical protein
LNRNVIDKEDIAVGPGPVSGLSYLYVGDIGGNDGRRQVQILRIPEPFVDSGRLKSPPSQVFSDTNTFTLTYPDGAYDAESLMVDPISNDVFVVTKGDWGARVYRANLTSLPNGSTVILAFVRSLPFAKASGGDISDDGTLIVMRRENFAKVWERDAGESVDSALSRTGRRIPVIGQPREENGEGIALLPNGMGYVTISEGENPVIYFFRAQCPLPPEFTALLDDTTGALARSITFRVRTRGYPQPRYQWFFNGQPLKGKRRSVLILSSLKFEQAGEYAVTASNRYGSVTSTATLTVVGQ